MYSVYQKTVNFSKFGSPIEAVSSYQYISVTDDGKIRILYYDRYGSESFEEIVEKDDRRIQRIEINWSKKDLNKKK